MSKSTSQSVWVKVQNTKMFAQDISSMRSQTPPRKCHDVLMDFEEAKVYIDKAQTRPKARHTQTLRFFQVRICWVTGWCCFLKENSFGPWPRPWKKLLLEFTTISIVTYMQCHTNNHVASPSSFKTLCFLWSITSKCGAFSVATWDSDQWANDQWSTSCWQQHPRIPLLLQKAMTFDCRVSNSSCLVGCRFICLLVDPTLLALLFLLDLEQLSSWPVTSD